MEPRKDEFLLSSTEFSCGSTRETRAKLSEGEQNESERVNERVSEQFVRMNEILRVCFESRTTGERSRTKKERVPSRYKRNNPIKNLFLPKRGVEKKEQQQ